MGIDPKPILDEIDAVLAEIAVHLEDSSEETEYPPGSAYEADEERARVDVAHAAACALAVSTIERFARPRSSYVTKALALGSDWKDTSVLRGLLIALRSDFEKGRLGSLVELLHADTFADYLDMAAHLLTDGGYYLPAAVIAGSTLEAHLRALAAKLGVDPNLPDGKAKKTTVLVADLAKVQAFSKGDEKQLLAWLDLRNLAAHGHTDKFQAPQVTLFIEGLRDFMRRVPA